MAGAVAVWGKDPAGQSTASQSLLATLLPDLTLQFALDTEGENPFPFLVSLDCQDADGQHAVDWQPQRLSSMTLTSGSTGLPKAAVHTCLAHLASAEGVLSLIPLAKRMTGCFLCRCFMSPGRGFCGAG